MNRLMKIHFSLLLIVTEKKKYLEISMMLSHAAMQTMEHSRTSD